MSIGLWAYYQKSYRTQAKIFPNINSSNMIGGVITIRTIKDLIFAIGHFLSLLILSGDIDLNPGPRKGNLINMNDLYSFFCTYLLITNKEFSVIGCLDRYVVFCRYTKKIGTSTYNIKPFSLNSEFF